MAIHPLRLVDYHDEEGKKIIDANIHRQEILGSGYWVGYSFTLMAEMYAIQGNGNGAAYQLRTFWDSFCSVNGFHLNGDYKNHGVSQWHYRPFTLEGNMWDYYNSFVIQPMYVDLINLFGDSRKEYADMKERVNARASRYASVLERMIAPDGSYPVLGRSICYRFGAFQMLAQAALQHRLEEMLAPAQVRCALTAVLDRCMEREDMFDENGWLLPGVYGHQPELAERRTFWRVKWLHSL